jgi:hypothetical protein
MIKHIKKIIPISIFLLVHNRRLQKRWRDLEEWNNIQRKETGPAPHLLKQQTIAEYQKKFKIQTFIETGSLYGDMIRAQRNRFKDLYTVELSKELYRFVNSRFRSDPNVHCFYGDSGKVLHEIIPKINNSSVFWLDGHYSGGATAKGELECPIFAELDAILRSKYNI